VQDAIRAEGLRCRIGKAWAVDGVTLQVKTGELFGLVGPDGAGKSTLVRMFTGTLQPTTGKLEVLGQPVSGLRGAGLLRAQVGYMSQTLSLYDDLSVLQNLRFCAQLFGVTDPTDRVKRLLAATGLTGHEQKLASNLSGGMRQKLALACALIHEPKLVCLDEPTTGVDPVSRRDFWELIVHFQKQGVTFVVCTPYMDEAERCHRVGFIMNGRILSVESPARLKKGFGCSVFEVAFPSGREALAMARKLQSDLSVRVVGDKLRVLVNLGVESVELEALVLKASPDSKIHLGVTSPSLEDVFVSLVQAP